jgi:GntR family transcriptional regulator / MocR family aminotransferase
MHFATILDRNLAAPLQRQICEQWRDAILTGRFRSGERVPSTREMAASLSVSRGTVSEAWEQLIAEGYLGTVHGSGTFVCSQLPDRLLNSRPTHSVSAEDEVKVRLSRYGAGLTEDWR